MCNAVQKYLINVGKTRKRGIVKENGERNKVKK